LEEAEGDTIVVAFEPVSVLLARGPLEGGYTVEAVSAVTYSSWICGQSEQNADDVLSKI
jgi:hypothetical protein